MGFFAFDDAGTLRVSRVVWIYPTIVIPLTITVFSTWVAWMKFRPNKLVELNKQLDEKVKRIERRNTQQGQP